MRDRLADRKRDRLGMRPGCDRLSMRSIFLLSLLAGALLFSGCEATVVDGRPYGRSSYRERGYDASDRGDYYDSRPVSYRDRRGYGSTQTRPVYATPYRTRSSYGRDREIQRVEVVTPHVQVQRTVVERVPSAHYRKMEDERDYR